MGPFHLLGDLLSSGLWAAGLRLEDNVGFMGIRIPSQSRRGAPELLNTFRSDSDLGFRVEGFANF